jgi:plastocyanin
LQATSFEVIITSSGFSPRILTIKVGDTVTWVNKDSAPHWPASDVHPTHRLYPGSGIEKCGSGEEIFDACKGLAPGETFSFTFKYKGTWPYHDHLNPGLTGTIIVQ